MGGKMKLLSGKTALRWLSATTAATKTGGQASDLCRNPTTSWGCPFMLQKGFFLAPINSNAVINLFLYSLLQRERVSSLWLQAGHGLFGIRQRDKNVFPSYSPLCKPEPPFELLLPHTTKQAELPTWTWNSMITRKTSGL